MGTLKLLHDLTIYKDKSYYFGTRSLSGLIAK
jgi:hypothetical protein